MKTLLFALALLLSFSLPVYADQASDAVLQEKIDQFFIVGFRGEFTISLFNVGPNTQTIKAG